MTSIIGVLDVTMERTPHSQYKIPGKQFSEQLERVDHLLDEQLEELRRSVIVENGGYVVERNEIGGSYEIETRQDILRKGVILQDIRKDPGGWSLAA